MSYWYKNVYHCNYRNLEIVTHSLGAKGKFHQTLHSSESTFHDSDTPLFLQAAYVVSFYNQSDVKIIIIITSGFISIFTSALKIKDLLSLRFLTF